VINYSLQSYGTIDRRGLRCDFQLAPYHLPSLTASVASLSLSLSLHLPGHVPVTHAFILTSTVFNSYYLLQKGSTVFIEFLLHDGLHYTRIYNCAPSDNKLASLAPCSQDRFVPDKLVTIATSLCQSQNECKIPTDMSTNPENLVKVGSMQYILHSEIAIN